MLQNYENKQRRSSSSVEELANTLKNLVLESGLKSKKKIVIIYAHTTSMLIIRKVYF